MAETCPHCGGELPYTKEDVEQAKEQARLRKIATETSVIGALVRGQKSAPAS